MLQQACNTQLSVGCRLHNADTGFLVNQLSCLSWLLSTMGISMLRISSLYQAAKSKFRLTIQAQAFQLTVRDVVSFKGGDERAELLQR